MHLKSISITIRQYTIDIYIDIVTTECNGIWQITKKIIRFILHTRRVQIKKLVKPYILVARGLTFVKSGSILHSVVCFWILSSTKQYQPMQFRQNNLDLTKYCFVCQSFVVFYQQFFPVQIQQYWINQDCFFSNKCQCFNSTFMFINSMYSCIAFSFSSWSSVNI